MTVYKIRINKNSQVTVESMILFFKNITKAKKYKMEYFFTREYGTKLGHQHWQAYVETNLDLTARQLLYLKHKQNIKDTKNAHSIIPSPDTEDGERYKAYCTKDLKNSNINDNSIVTSLSQEEIQKLMEEWCNKYKPLSDKNKKNNSKKSASERLMSFLKENEYRFLEKKDGMTYEWHEDLLKLIIEYYKINTIFFDNYVTKKAMCLALATYDREYLDYVITDKWQDFVKDAKTI